MQLPSFRDLLYRLTSQATHQALKTTVNSDNAASRFPVVVRPQTRAFLEAQAAALGASLAGLSGSILDSVAASQIEAVAYSGEGITSRFYLLLKEHGLSLPAAAEVLRELGITAGDMSVPNVLLEKLTAQNIEWISNHFSVSYEWLAGSSENAIPFRYHTWYKQQIGAAHRLLELSRSALSVNFCLVRRSGFDYESDSTKTGESSGSDAAEPEFYPVMRMWHRAGPQEEYETFEAWDSGRWSYWRCREHIKMVVYFAIKLARLPSLDLRVSGLTLDPKTFASLSEGKILLPTLFKSMGASQWHPDDFVEPSSSVAKDPTEWKRIFSSPEYAGDFQAFTELMQSLQKIEKGHIF